MSIPSSAVPRSPTPPLPSPASGFRWRRGRNWLLLGLLYAAYYLCRYNLSTVTPELAREFNFDNQQTGWMSTARDFGYAVGTFINGLFADALGGKQAMAVGGVGTILLNLSFGWFSTWDVAFLLTGFIVIRAIDGYAQSFGSPGMVKINTSWFARRERGKFSGVFGAVIQLGQIGVYQLSSLLLGGTALVLFGYALFEIPRQNWRIMFIVPPVILAVILVVMWLGTKNHPEEAGYTVAHDDEAPSDGSAPTRLPLDVVFRKIASNPLIWLNAGAYMCTGFVRRAYDFWWAKYLDNVWDVGKGSAEFRWLGFLLPLAAIVGSFGAGYVSDAFFRSRRSPVAAVLYGVESVVILGSILVLSSGLASPLVACVFLALISLTCNSSHSIIGSAAVMDIGGRQMAGFALGVVNSFQYIGSILAGFALGALIDAHGWSALFVAMLPFSILGAVLMTIVWWSTRGRDVRGA